MFIMMMGMMMMMMMMISRLQRWQGILLCQRLSHNQRSLCIVVRCIHLIFLLFALELADGLM